MKSIVFNVATGGLPKDEILYLMPEFSAPANYKDAEKIQTWKARKQEEWLLDAALSALSGRVLAIAYQADGEDCKIISDDDEAKLLEKFWNVYRNNGDCNFVGYNARNFDVPFLIRRSWRNRVIIPNVVNGRFLNGKFIDIMQLWGCGCAERVSLNTLLKFFGINGDAADEVSFSTMWEISRDSAINSLKHGIALTRTVGEAMGLLDAEGDLF